MGGHQSHNDEFYTDDSADGLFILRLIDILADHTEPLAPTADERLTTKSGTRPERGSQGESDGLDRSDTGMPPGQAPSLWRQTTPELFLWEIQTDHGKAAGQEIRRRIKQALKDELLDDALFLLLTMARLPQYRREERDRVPWGG